MKLFRNEHGSILIPIMIVSSIAMMAFFSFSQMIETARKEQKQLQTIVSVDMIRANLVTYLNDPVAWSKTVADISNVSMDCLRALTPCPGGGLVRLNDTQGNLVFNSAAATSGFQLSAQACSTFDTVSGNDACPIRAEISWVPDCAVPCTPSQIIINVDFQIRTTNARHVNFNKSKYQVSTKQSTVVVVGSPPAIEAISIAVGDGFGCAIMSTSAVKCWGRNESGQLANGTILESLVATDVIGLPASQSIASGASVACALSTTGGVKCWGWGMYGALGNGAALSSSTPVDVVGLTSGVKAIAVGGWQGCALTLGGGIKCWGLNLHGELGNGTIISSLVPVDVIGLASGVQAIAAGWSRTCALMITGGVKCWGMEFPVSGPTVRLTSPVDVPGLGAGVQAISVGGNHACALMTAGNVQCWGANSAGQLGDGTLTASSSPVNVVGSAGTASIAAGSAETCSVSTTGVMKCWGSNYFGQIGNGSSGVGNGVDVVVPTLVDAIAQTGLTSAVSTYHSQVCALAGKKIRCWGSPWGGGIGNGTRFWSEFFPMEVVF